MDDILHIKSKRLVAMTKSEYQDIHFKVDKLLEAMLEMKALIDSQHTDTDMRLERIESILETFTVEEDTEIIFEIDEEE